MRVSLSVLVAAILVLTAGAVLAEDRSDAQPSGATPVDISAATEPLKTLGNLYTKAAKAGALAQKTKKQADVLNDQLAKARNELQNALSPPPPGATASVVRQRQQKAQEQREKIASLEGSVTEKTLAAVQAEKEFHRSARAVQQFEQEHPAVRLPDDATVTKKLRSLELSLGDNHAYQQGLEAAANTSRFDNPGPASPTVDLRPDNAKDPLPLTEQQLRVRQELEAEAAAIQAEAQRLREWAEELERWNARLNDRVTIHNNTAYDSESQEAVEEYNREAEQLNGENENLKAEAARFNAERETLLERAAKFDRRLAAAQ
jgi:hypothetical protein